jgi:DNA-binding XRE family transcriptional regulator
MEILHQGAIPAMSNTPIEPLAMIPGGMWDQVGWWDEVKRNKHRRFAVGLKLRRERRSLGVTQAALALHIGVSQELVSRWECGERPVSGKHIRKIEDFLGRALYAEVA